MNRFLLTMLALLTGLVAQVSPAQAALQAGGEAEVGSVQTVRSAVRLTRQGPVRVSGKTEGATLAERHSVQPLPRLVIGTIAVRIGIDRAHQ